MLIGNYGVGIVPLSVDQIYVFITEIFTKMTKASEKIMTSQCDYCDNSEINGSIIWALTREALPLLYTNNHSADQPAHPRCLINAFAVRVLENIMSSLATWKISIF